MKGTKIIIASDIKIKEPSVVTIIVSKSRNNRKYSTITTRELHGYAKDVHDQIEDIISEYYRKHSNVDMDVYFDVPIQLRGLYDAA